MPSASLFTILSATVVVLYAIGAHYLINSPKDRSCSMTYMFEYPHFAKIPLPDEVSKKFKRYSLYAYSEGHQASTSSSRPMKFTGIPVLFIPGSGGSFKQARSLASVCMRKALNSRSSFYMDFFSVDLNEEYSALYGGALEPQTEFVRQSILRILDLYKGNKGNKPTSVVLVGHSMVSLQILTAPVGFSSRLCHLQSGLIAKGIFNDPAFDPKMVQLILTFATPHSRPVVVFDEYTYKYYQATSKTWLTGRSDKLAHVTIASIGGGHMDYLVQTDSVASWDVDVHTVTTTVPTVWRSVDHLAILWCKELVLVTARALFDTVDHVTRQISNDRNQRIAVLSYHFLNRNSAKQYRKSHYSPTVPFIEDADWVEPGTAQLSVAANVHEEKNPKMNKPLHLMIRLVDLPQHSTLSAEVMNHPENDWVFVCNANQWTKDKVMQICKNGVNLSNVTTFWPSLSYKRKRVVLDLFSLQQQNKFSHVILRMPYNNEVIQLHMDVHVERILKPPALGPWLLYDTRHFILEKQTFPKALRYVVDFSEVESLWHVFHLWVKPISCEDKEHQAAVVLVIPWSNEKIYNLINEGSQNPLPIRLLHVKPRLPKNAPKTLELRMSVKAEINLDPTCSYRISMQAAPGLLLSQFARSLTPCIFAYVVAILLLTLREQLKSMKETGHCSLFHLALSRGAKPFYILPLCKILTRLLTEGDELNSRLSLSGLGIPEPGMNMMASLPFENLLYPFLLYMCAFGLVYLVGFVLMFAVVFNAKVMNGFALSFLGRFFKRSITAWLSPSSLSDFVMEFMIRAPPVVVAILLIIAFKSCGALALVIGGLYFYMVLCNMYGDYMEALLKYSMKVVAGKAKISVDGIVNPGASGASPSQPSSQSISKKSLEMKEDEKHVAELKENPKKAVISSKLKDVKDSKKVDPEDEERNSLSDINVYMTVFLLYVTAVVPSIPSLLTWAHNYKFDQSLDPDPTFTPFIILLMSVASTFWIHAYPHPQLPCYRIIVDILFTVATFTLLYAPNRISFVPYIICSVMALLASHQWVTTVHLFFFPPYNEQVDSDNESNADSVNDNHIDSSHSGSDDEVADGDDEGCESGSNSDYNEDANVRQARKVFPVSNLGQPNKSQADDDSSEDADCVASSKDKNVKKHEKL